MNRLLQWQIKKSREITDKTVSNVLDDKEALRWSGAPGFVATFNSREFVLSIIITVIISIIAVIMFGNSSVGLPADFYALLSATVCVLTLLTIGWIRQIYRYITTLGVYYAVTDSRLVIIKRGKIISELPLAEVKSVSVSKKLLGNGSVVFNEGEDYLRSNLVESPTKKVFCFFNVLDVENVTKACSR